MKKTNLLLLLGGLCFMISSCNNESGITKSGKLEEVTGGEKRALKKELKWSGGLVYFNSTLFTGVAFEMLNKNKFREEATYKDGKQDGPYKKYYYPDGQLREDGNYKDGKRDGPHKVYWRDGQLNVEKNYKDGELDGPYKVYYNNGKLKEEVNY